MTDQAGDGKNPQATTTGSVIRSSAARALYRSVTVTYIISNCVFGGRSVVNLASARHLLPSTCSELSWFISSVHDVPCLLLADSGITGFTGKLHTAVYL